MILSDQWVLKSISEQMKQATPDYNLGVFFKIVCCGDRSVFYVKPVEQDAYRKGKKGPNLPALIEQSTKLEAYELRVL